MLEPRLVERRQTQGSHGIVSFRSIVLEERRRGGSGNRDFATTGSRRGGIDVLVKVGRLDKVKDIVHDNLGEVVKVATLVAATELHRTQLGLGEGMLDPLAESIKLELGAFFPSRCRRRLLGTTSPWVIRKIKKKGKHDSIKEETTSVCGYGNRE